MRLKQRVMGNAGHLSNDQALAAIRQVLARSRRAPRHVVLLHLSRQCNCPKLVRRLYDRRPDIAGRLCLASQSRRTEWLRLDRRPARAPVGEQLAIFE